MEIVIMAPTEKQVDAIYAEVGNAFAGSHIRKFTDIFYAVQYIVNHKVNQVYAEAEVRNPFSLTKFVKLIRTYGHTVDITIVSGNAKDKDVALAAGADYFTDYERLTEVLAAIKPIENQQKASLDDLRGAIRVF